MDSKPTFCLYARKSSESDERQAMSIDSQINEMSNLAKRDGVLIKEIRQESHSAKQSGARPVFQKLIDDIRQGIFNGILTWAPDRLSRNAGDLGMIVDLMDQEKLLQIKTYGQVFSNTPNDKFLLMILCSQAKLENDQKGINVKRGIKAKCEMGWRPNLPPIGYLNRTFNGVKDIVIDQERAPAIKEMFEKTAYYYHSGRMIKKWLDEIGFTTRKGKRVSLSMIYNMLRNPFYYGEFESPIGSGNWYKGSHKPLITKEDYDEVQKELTSPKKSPYGKKEFTYKGIFTCFTCGTSICGEEKIRKRKDGTFRKHVYYHCTRSKNFKCKQPYLKEKDFIKEILKKVDELPLDRILLPQNIYQRLQSYKEVAGEEKFLKSSSYNFSEEFDLKDIIKYALLRGTSKFKRDLLLCLPIHTRFNNGTLTA
ncbi:MAG: recombinase family protein [bacterium]